MTMSGNKVGTPIEEAYQTGYIEGYADGERRAMLRLWAFIQTKMKLCIGDLEEEILKRSKKVSTGNSPGAMGTND